MTVGGPLDVADERFEGALAVPPRSVFEACEFVGVDLQAARLTQVRFVECRFEGGSLAGADLDRAVWRDVTFEGVKLLGIDWTRARALSGLAFTDCRLDDSAWLGLDLTGIGFERCSLRRALFAGARLREADLRGSDLTDADLREADLTAADARDTTGLALVPTPDLVRGLRVDPATALELARHLGLRLDSEA